MKRTILLPCFFLSGVAGLVYEVLWTRMLALSFGHTVWALTTVLAIFMGGLALGSLLFGKVADRSASPARLYALLEAGIGLCCLAVPFLLELSRHARMALLPVVGDGMVPRTLIQFLLAGAVLIVPTTLMGGTVPAMARAMIGEADGAGRRFGLLYAANTLGAATGAFAAGYWLIPAIGMAATNRLAAAANLAVGAVILLSGGAASAPAAADVQDACGAAPDPLPVAAVPDPVLLWAFGLTGATAMVFQIAWVRSLVMVIGSSTYAYSAILVTFLFGIALGSWLISRTRMGGPTTTALLLAGIAFSVFLLLPFFDRLPMLFLLLYKGFTGDYAYIQLVQFLIVFIVVLVPTTLMGMTLPSMMGMVIRKANGVGKRVGRHYAFNTAGSIVGSVLAGFILIPRFGAQKTIAGGIILELAMAAVFLFFARPAGRRKVVAAFAALGVAALLLPSWSPGALNMAVSIVPWKFKEEGFFRTESRRLAGALLYSREGISSNVSVFGKPDGGERFFTVNGKSDGGTGDMTTQVRLALVPMVLRPGARRVAVIGLGTGVTAGTAGLFGSTRSIDIVELEPAVVEAARYFGAENNGILSDPRARVHFDDGRSFFDSRRAAYDVIVSEPSNPWISGVSNLYTLEFFRSIRESLAEGGVFGLWVQGYTISRESYALILRTFLDVFPDATLWRLHESDTLLLGRKGGDPLIASAAIRTSLMDSPKVVAAFGERGELPLDPLFTSFLLGPREIRRFAGPGARNTDDRNILEFSAPRSLYRHEWRGILDEIVQVKASVLPPFLTAPATASPEFHMRAGEKHLAERNGTMALWEFGQVPSIAPVHMPGEEPLQLSDGGVLDDFERPTIVPFVPVAGRNRPESVRPKDLAFWQASIAQLSRTSGVVRGAGWNGSAGLVLRGIPVSPTGYFVPLEVEPGAEYEVRCKIRSDAGADGQAGIRLWEYDARTDDGSQPTAAFDASHRVAVTDLLEVRGRAGWAGRAALFAVTPRTSAVRLFFYLSGRPGSSASFDDIAIRRVR